MGAFDLSRYLWPSADARRQPEAGLVVNREHPLAQYFSHVFVPGLAGPDGSPDLLGNAALVPFGSGAAAPGRKIDGNGQSITLNGSQKAYHTAAGIPGSATWPICMFAWGWFLNGADNYPLVGMGRSGGSAGADQKTIRLYSTTQAQYYTRENFGSISSSLASFGTIGSLVGALSQSLSATDHRLYCAGAMVTDTTNTGNPASAYNMIGIGASFTGAPTPSKLLAGGVLVAAIGFRAIPDAIALELTRDPGIFWEMFAPSARIFLPGASASGAQLAGSAAAQAIASGTLTTGIPLVAASASVATANGTLTTAIPLTGSAASVAVANGVLTTTIKLSGAALATAAAAGALTTQINLNGAAVMQAMASADLTTSPQGLSAAASASASGTAALSTGIKLAGAASAIAIGSGGLTTAIKLAGAAAAACNATGALTVSIQLSAAALAQAVAAGTLSTQIRLNAAAVMSALASASFTSSSPAALADPRYRANGARRSFVTVGEARAFRSLGRARSFVA